jgi:L-lactate dehydrogenase (cytochrome)
MPTPATATDYRAKAKARLPRMLFDYIDGGAYAEHTLERNVADFEPITLRQRVMQDVSKVDMSVELFGQTLAAPIILSPVGLAGMYARRGEVQAARAAKAAGLPFCLSTVGLCAIDEVAKGAAPPWFQLYVMKDRGHMRELLSRAKAAGCPVLVLTVDLQTPGTRYRDIRSGMTGAGGLGAQISQAMDGIAHPAWLWDVMVNGGPHAFGNLTSAIPKARSLTDFWTWIGANFDPSMTWKDMDMIRDIWDGPILVKGVLDVRDARDAVSAGARGIVVSNHGGRQLDGAISSIAALPPIVEAVGDKTTVLMDGGVRSGLDVLKAMSLGAKGVLIGRAWAFALGAGGEATVSAALARLKAELRTAMMLTGRTDLK